MVNGRKQGHGHFNNLGQRDLTRYVNQVVARTSAGLKRYSTKEYNAQPAYSWQRKPAYSTS